MALTPSPKTGSALVAKDLMTPDPTVVKLSTKVRDAFELLETLEIRHLPVLDDSRSVVGMLSERDLRSASIQHILGGQVASVGNVLNAPVSELMSSDVISVMPETEIGEIIDLLIETKVGAVPVIDEETEELLGIVSYIDVLRALRQ
jgi:acetoin utilization protein AcuB